MTRFISGRISAWRAVKQSRSHSERAVRNAHLIVHSVTGLLREIVRFVPLGTLLISKGFVYLNVLRHSTARRARVVPHATVIARAVWMGLTMVVLVAL